MAAIDFSAEDVLRLFLRDADQRKLPGDTRCSIGWWTEETADDPPQFHARLALTLDEIRAVVAPVPGEVRKETL